MIAVIKFYSFSRNDWCFPLWKTIELLIFVWCMVYIVQKKSIKDVSYLAIEWFSAPNWWVSLNGILSGFCEFFLLNNWGQFIRFSILLYSARNGKEFLNNRNLRWQSFNWFCIYNLKILCIVLITFVLYASMILFNNLVNFIVSAKLHVDCLIVSWKICGQLMYRSYC